MDQGLDKKYSFKENFIFFIKKNKFKLCIFLSIILISLFLLVFLKYNKEKQNIIISEKYIKAGLLLSEGKKQEAKNLFEEIILSKNKFYSILALNSVVEKKLISDKEKILKYFIILENLASNKTIVDLINLKKALYLINEANFEEGNKILEKLVEKNSTLKIIAQELIKK